MPIRSTMPLALNLETTVPRIVLEVDVTTCP
jgi:hypothetical protein